MKHKFTFLRKLQNVVPFNILAFALLMSISSVAHAVCSACEQINDLNSDSNSLSNEISTLEDINGNLQEQKA
jgi:large-conductance mechanosensitive channel